ncbi:HU family DNA-binding protein [Streptomyces coelicoflavus]|uniref:HU family DNA-binding protein n=1 Tax=Streptomyces coelicoflavus TaxID=285562 RepID=UPI003698267C
MDKTHLTEATASRAAGDGGDRQLDLEAVSAVLDAVFGTVEHPGSIAEALRRGETVTAGSFGSFHTEGDTATFRPGKALTEYLRKTTE